MPCMTVEFDRREQEALLLLAERAGVTPPVLIRAVVRDVSRQALTRACLASMITCAEVGLDDVEVVV